MSEENAAPCSRITFSIASRGEWETLFDPTPPLSACPFGRALCQLAQTLPPDEAEGICNALAFAANELVENALRFNVKGAITLRCGLLAGEWFCAVGNKAHHDAVPALRARLSTLSEGDPGDLLCAHVERTMGTAESGIGYLTLLHDYGVRLGWGIEPYSPELMQLWVTAYLPTTKGARDGS